MSDKFDMKLVIDAVTTPLLHGRLSQARSFRERAAMLRSLAESALRAESTLVRIEPASVSMALASSHTAGSIEATHAGRVAMPAQTGNERMVAGEHQPRSLSEGGSTEAHDVAQIADEFGSYF